MKIMRSGKEYEFPDDASLEEINEYFGVDNKSIPSHHGERAAKIAQGDIARDILYGVAKGGENVNKTLFGENAAQIPNEPESSNKLAIEFGKYLPSMIAGGASIPGQAIASGLYEMTQANPNEENLNGILPSGKVGAGLKTALETAIAGRLLKLPSNIKSGIDYLRPGKLSSEYVSKLAPGLESREQNYKSLIDQIKNARDKSVTEALEPKNKLLSSRGNEKIIPIKNKGDYLSIKKPEKLYDDALKELHNEYKKNPTLTNADKLLSALKEEQRNIINKPGGKRALDVSERNRYGKISKLVDNLSNDLTKYVDNLPANEKGLYKEFTQKWRQNVSPFEAKKSLRMIATGKGEELTEDALKRIFRSPSPRVQNVLGQLPENAKRQILFDQLSKANPSDAKNIANAIKKLNRSGGYSKYLTNKDKEIADELLKRLKYRKYGAAAAGTLGGLTGAGLLTDYIYKRLTKD